MAEPVGGVSRRRVMQGVAWAAPAIVVATAVPARAASGDPSTLIVDSMQAQIQGDELRIDLPAIRNQPDGENGDTYTNVTIYVSVPAGAATTPPRGEGAAWTIVGASGSDPLVVTCVYADAIPPNGTALTGFLYLPRPLGAPASGSVDVSGTGFNGTENRTILFPEGTTITYG